MTRRRTGLVLRGSVLAGTVAVVTAALVLLLSVTVLTAAHVAWSAAPSLPEPSVDVAAIDDLTAAVGRTGSRSSVVLDASGAVFGRFQPEERYRPLDPGDVPGVVEAALLAAEDDSFRSHHGFDPASIVRALVRNVRSGEIEQGGSTLTQQLAKNLFTGDDDSLDRKLQELRTAVEIERRFSKDEILAAYVNSVFLGNGNFGFEAAAQDYFGKPAAELSRSEAALLVGMLPAPSARDPRSNPEAADRARRRGLDRMVATGFATSEEAAAAAGDVPVVQPRAPRTERFPYYMDYVRRYLLDDVGIDPDELYSGGLRIETGLVPAHQEAGRRAVAEVLPAGAGPDAALAVVDVRTGLVTAVVGGRDFDRSQVNLALGALGGGTGRQAGSSFKPFVLATALEQGHVPSQEIAAPREYLPTTVDDPKPVHNFAERGYGRVSLREATIGSINTAFVNLTEAVGAAAVRDTAARLGVRGLPESVGPSIGIGAYETSPLDMASAYAAFSSDGRRVDTGPVTRILTADGEVFADLTPTAAGERTQILSRNTARHVNQILAENARRGTATRAALDDHPVAAKTGTADEYTNAWLAGYTRQYAAAVWVGHPEGNVPMYDVAGFSRVTGGSLPALIWHRVMAAVHEGIAPAGFPPPGPTTETPTPFGPETGGTTTTAATRPSNRPTTTPAPTTAPTTTAAPAPPTTPPPTMSVPTPTSPTTTQPTTTTNPPTTSPPTTTTTTTAPPPTTAPPTSGAASPD